MTTKLLFFFYDLWTFIWVSCAFSFLLKAAPTVAASGCSRSFLNQSLKTEDNPQVFLPHLPFTVPDMGLLLMGLKKHPSQYVPCPVKHLPFHSSKALTGFLIPTTSNLLFWLSMFFCSVNLHVFMCVCVCACGESSGILWTRRSSHWGGLFSALNKIWQLEYAIHYAI